MKFQQARCLPEYFTCRALVEPARVEALEATAAYEQAYAEYSLLRDRTDAIGELAREEAWRTPIYVECGREGMTALEAAARCEALTAAIEQNIRSIQAGARTGLDQPAEFADYQKWSLAVERVVPLTPTSDGGYVAKAEVVTGCLFRINKPIT